MRRIVKLNTAKLNARAHVKWTQRLHRKLERPRMMIDKRQCVCKNLKDNGEGLNRHVRRCRTLKTSETGHFLVPSEHTALALKNIRPLRFFDKTFGRASGNQLCFLLPFSRKYCQAIILLVLIAGINWRDGTAEASLIIGDSAIEIQEVDSGPSQSSGQQQETEGNQNHGQQKQVAVFQQVQDSASEQPSIILGSTSGINVDGGSIQLAEQQSEPLAISGNSLNQASQHAGTQGDSLHTDKLDTGLQARQQQQFRSHIEMPAPLPPLQTMDSPESSSGVSGHRAAEPDITDGDKNSRNNHDYDINELVSPGSLSEDSGDIKRQQQQLERTELSKVLLVKPEVSGAQGTNSNHHHIGDKSIAGKVVDFELQPAGGHNKAKIKKKKERKKKEKEMFKKWDKKKKAEKKAMEKEHKEEMKKKKEEGKKGKKKWGHEEHGQKKKGNFKKKKWGEKIKKGKGIKKGKKGKKFLLDKGHKNTGFKTVYHKEEWGKSSKWHDIKREKKWDEKSKKWKKKWKKEKGKKYKGDHMKKFEDKKKYGKKYKKEHKDKFKKSKKEEYEKGKKKRMEEHKKKKENGAKKEMKKKKKGG